MNKAQPAKHAQRASPAIAAHKTQPSYQPENVKMIPVKGSSNVAVIGYHKDSQTLHVAYHSGGHYTYQHVPPKLYEELMKSDSKGSFIHKHIKGRHQHTKLL